MAEAFGRSLLSEVDEVGLNEILQVVRARQDQRQSRVDDVEVGDTLVDEILRLNRKDASPNITELISPIPDNGASSLFYHLIATILSSPSANATIVLIDCDSSFSVTHLAEHFAAIILKDAGANATEGLAASIQHHLHHLHVLRPQSMASLLSSLEALPSYLLDAPVSHHSYDRTLALVAVHNFTSLAVSDGASLSSTAAFSAAVHSLSKALSFPPTVISTWNPASTSLPPPPLAGMRSRRLVVRREVVRKFPASISVEEALREKGDRWSVVSRGRFEISELGGRGWKEVFRVVGGMVMTIAAHPNG
ncbi:hypothetical protein K431DRAFT_314692 [Polychaeton citri CBS 116435]|uniref:DNA recombination and repair protein Rad51-like C-terminal domain-containing protein n=1 Tax=Polychaeton citri CBS 116435 TaxID=1314669 RepID=A0A9P4Q683_9PEZI|nr:hypothetical protein K431DRAFT_314692 [Polychaeton citri CBS 116435]